MYIFLFFLQMNGTGSYLIYLSQIMIQIVKDSLNLFIFLRYGNWVKLSSLGLVMVEFSFLSMTSS